MFAYLCGWVLAASCTFFAGRRLSAEPMAPSQSVVYSIVTGTLWPLLVLGALEIGSLAFLLKLASRRRRRLVAVPLSFVAEY